MTHSFAGRLSLSAVPPVGIGYPVAFSRNSPFGLALFPFYPSQSVFRLICLSSAPIRSLRDGIFLAEFSENVAFYPPESLFQEINDVDAPSVEFRKFDGLSSHISIVRRGYCCIYGDGQV